MTCPRCVKGNVLDNHYGELECVNCGYAPPAKSTRIQWDIDFSGGHQPALFLETRKEVTA